MFKIEYSDNQKKKVNETLMSNLDKAATSMTFNILESDFYLKELKNLL